MTGLPSPRARTARGACDDSVDRDAVWSALTAVEDPELPVGIVDLGLVRELDVRSGRVRVGMTFTSLACPCVDMLMDDVRDAVAAVRGVTAVEVDEVLEPWSRADVSAHGLDLLRAVAVV